MFAQNINNSHELPFQERELTLPMALSTMVRGFMTCKSTVNRKWTPLTNQEYSSVRQRTRAM